MMRVLGFYVWIFVGGMLIGTASQCHQIGGNTYSK
jgi:hypothetical protein